MNPIKSPEIEVATIHNIERFGNESHRVQNFDVMHFALGNVDKTGDIATNINQGV